MSWSKVTNWKQMPIGWWWHKIWCEVGYAIRRIIRTDRMYYRHLDALLKYGFNLYGESAKYKWFIGDQEIPPPSKGAAVFTGNTKK